MTATAQLRPTIPIPNRIRLTVIAVAAAGGGFLFGKDSANINAAILGIQKYFQASPALIGLVGSSALIGAPLGAWAAGSLLDRIGRCRTMQITGALFLIGAIGAMFPFSVWDMAAWRCVGGFGVGLASVVGPAYIAEVTPAAYRGRLTSLQQLSVVVGLSMSAFVNWGLKNTAPLTAPGIANVNAPLVGVQTWQWMIGAVAVPALIYLILVLFIPESPHFLIARGRLADAKAVLQSVERSEEQYFDNRIAEIASPRNTRTPRFRDRLNPRSVFLPIVWLGIAIAAFQQLVGINVVFNYSDALWSSVGLDTQSLLISVASPLVYVLGTVIAIIFIDRVGRKPLLLIGSIGMSVGLAVTAVAFGHVTGSGDHLALHGIWGPVALVAANIFVLAFAMSWGVIAWVLLSEIFPLGIRSAAVAIGSTANWIANWAINATFPSMPAWNLPATYWIYTTFAFLSIAVVVLFVRETKGTRLEDVR